jgi:hypothetical protein
MSTRSLAVVVIVAALLLGAVAMAAETRPDSRREGNPADSMLNSRGREGWELVAVTRREIRVDDTLQTETLYAFKRSTRSVNR